MSEDNDMVPTISPLGPNRLPTVANWAEQYKALNKHRWSASKLDSANREINRLALFVGTREFTPQALAEFQADVHTRKVGAYTIIQTLSVVGTFIKWLDTMGYVDHRRFAGIIRKPPPPPPDPKIFTEAQYERVKAAARGTYWYYAVIMGYRTGARYSDVALLKWSDVHLDECYVRYIPFKSRKTGKCAVCPFDVGGDLHQVLQELSMCRGSAPKGWENYVYPDLAMTYPMNGLEGAGPIKRREFKRLCDQNGARGLSFHKLRNSFMSRLVKSGVSYPMASQITGITDHAMFDRYANPDLDALRKVMNKMDKKDDPPDEGTIIKLPGAA